MTSDMMQWLPNMQMYFQNKPAVPVGFTLGMSKPSSINLVQDKLLIDLNLRAIVNSGAEILEDFELKQTMFNLTVGTDQNSAIVGHVDLLQYFGRQMVNAGSVLSNPRDIDKISSAFD